MKKCKYCQSEIDSKAKICPNCRKKQNKFPVWLRVLLAFLIIIIGIGLLGEDTSTNNNNGSTNENNTNNNENKNEEKFSYEVTNSAPDEYNISYYIEGTVTNNKDKEYSYVQIEFICYDSEGNNLGTALDNTNNLLGNETWKFKAVAMFSDVENIDHCDFKDITSW